MIRIRQTGRRGIVWMGLALGSIVVAATIAASSPPSRPSEPEAEEETFIPPKLSPATLVAKDLVVHEWGTFLGMNASDGTVLDGMYHEEHALPSFVHSRARDQLRLPSMRMKGETPVIYFYTPSPVSVRVGVGFPKGIWTQWYPQAAVIQPSLLEQAQAPDRLTNGRICWYAEVIPASLVPMEVSKRRGAIPSPTTLDVPETRSDALWNFARDVDAAFVKTIDVTKQSQKAEYERFLFYRGLGQSRMPMRVDARSGGTLAIDREPSIGEGVRHIFVLKVENGRGAYQYRSAMRPGEQATGVIPSMVDAKPLAEFTAAVADALAAKLAEVGLYPKEGRAMVNTWKNSYFQNDGIRVLFVLPQSWTDAFVPISIVPRPREVVRVMVGRLELLSLERERLAESAIRDLAGPDPAGRRAAFQYLRDQGRYVEPIVRRIARTTNDDGVRTICHQLLQTELVTDLRAAIHNATDGKRLDSDPLVSPSDPLLLRAQLSRLLREIGRTEEARAEGGAVWREIRNRSTSQKSSQADDAGTLEIRGAVYEATGDDRRATETYAQRLEGHVNSLAPNVHLDLYAWVREWWVGRAYARCMVRTGQAEATITALQEKVDRVPSGVAYHPDDRLNRVRLGLLLDARGPRDRAEAYWSSLMAKPDLKSTAVLVPTLPKL